MERVKGVHFADRAVLDLKKELVLRVKFLLKEESARKLNIARQCTAPA